MRRLAGLLVLVPLTAALVSATAQSGPDARIADAACGLPTEWLERIWRGTDPHRSGEIVMVPRFPNFVGNLSHAGPWPYLQRIPMFWYGPGHIAAAGVVDRHVTLADVAATYGQLLGHPWPHGTAMHEVVQPDTDPPALVVTVVLDGGGRDVLDTWPDDWPVLASLIHEGTWYEHAIVGSSPSTTAASHATLGTGLYPREHGEIDIDMRVGPFLMRSDGNGVRLLVRPTFADLYDAARGNEPLVGTIGSGIWHLYMMGHGSMWGHGDRDIAVLRPPIFESDPSGARWRLPDDVRPFFTFPRYVNGVPSFERYLDELDREDGRLDEAWREHPFTTLEDGFDTPARIPFQTDVVEEVISREGFGTDDVPDLLFVNYKVLDKVGHLWSVNGREMRDTLRWQDEYLGRLIEILDERVGRGRWALLVTADHGHQYDPKVSGAFRIAHGQLRHAIDERFDDGDGRRVTEAVHSTQVFLDLQELADVGASLDEVARFLLDFTQSDGARYGATEVEPGARVFDAVIPRGSLAELPCIATLSDH
jgi:arylsulfatase A-like enzyme